MTDTSSSPIKLKVCLAGEAAVGKTSLMRRFVYDVFDEGYATTIGAKITKKELSVIAPNSRRRRDIVLIIWDIMGTHVFRELLKDAYFHGAQGVLAVCDVSRPETLSELEGWRRLFQKVTGKIPAWVLANKVDLADNGHTKEQGLKRRCERWGYPYIFTSAKTGDGVEEAFQGLTKMVLEEYSQS